MRARVIVTLKSGVLDPQGKAIGGALASLGIDGVGSVRQGKVFDVELVTEDSASAEDTLRSACEKLLANTVIENYRFELESASADAARTDDGRADNGKAGKRRKRDELRAQESAAQSAAEDTEMPIEGHP